MSLFENQIEYTKKNLPSGLTKTGIALTIIGLIVIILAYFVDHQRSAFNNIILLMFLTSIGVGSIFLVAVEYVSGAVWSTPFRRVSEFLAFIVIVLPIIALPLYFNLHEVFHWMHPEAVAMDANLRGKAPYLNVTFFVVRVLVFFAIWIIFYLILTKRSKKQDETKDQKLTTKNIKTSAIFIPFFAITLTFSGIDWMMSLEPHWFSTIFGVYYFAGTMLAALATAAFIIVWLNERGYFVKGIIKEHYYSLGALMFAFVNFWAYIAFSQYLLIWYANLPEETVWFLQRWEGSWLYFSIALVIIHFAVPYFGLLSQPSKMNPKRLLFMSAWIVFAHFVDLYWIVMPTLSSKGALIGWIEIGYPVFAVGLIILLFSFKAKKENLVAIGDPKLKRGIDFRL